MPTASQALVLALAERWLKDTLPPSVRRELQADCQAAQVALQADPKHAAWLENARVFQHWDAVLDDPIADQKVVDTLQQALLDQRQVTIHYRQSSSGEKKSTRLHPLGWARRNGVAYLACTFWDYADLRWLAVHRICDAQPLDEPVKHHATSEAVAAFLQHPPMVPNSEDHIQLELKLREHLYCSMQERPLHGEAIQIDPPKDGWFRVTGRVPNSQGLRWWLLGLQDNARILKPDRLRKELHHFLFDPLTGLLNRYELNLALPHRLAETRRTKDPLSVIALDLDYFSEVNNHFGHPVGDLALCHAADILKASCRDMDTAARQGGEEFLLLLPKTTSQDAEMIAERVRKALQEPLPLKEEAAHKAAQLRQNPQDCHLRFEDAGLILTASLGIATEDGQDQQTPIEELTERLLKRADDALYSAKQAGKDCVRIDRIPQPPAR